MPSFITRLFGRPKSSPCTLVSAVPSGPAEGERRRQVLRSSTLGLLDDACASALRVNLARRGFDLRVDDITELGVSAWAPVNTWALHPGPRRQVWVVYRDRQDPLWSDTHIFATFDNVTLLAATLMPTRLPARGEALMLRTEFSLVSHQADISDAREEGALACLRGDVPALWATPSRWFVPEQAWLSARDPAELSLALATLVSDMVKTLERAGAAQGPAQARAA